MGLPNKRMGVVMRLLLGVHSLLIDLEGKLAQGHSLLGRESKGSHKGGAKGTQAARGRGLRGRRWFRHCDHLPFPSGILLSASDREGSSSPALADHLQDRADRKQTRPPHFYELLSGEGSVLSRESSQQTRAAWDGAQ